MRFFLNLTPHDIKYHRVLVLIQGKQKLFNSRCFSTISSPSSSFFIKPDYLRNEALKRYGLSNLNLVWPENTIPSQPVDYIKKNPKSISQMYGKSDLSKLPIFQGGFINFGYWPNSLLHKDKISVEERTACSKEMYKVVGDLAGILKKHSILDIGCGLGYGTAFFSEYYQPKLVVGLDISPEQIARAKVHHVAGISKGKLRFTLGEAESMPFTDNSFDCVLSIEAAQHFSSILDFSQEVSRILKPGGKLVITSFFPRNKEGKNALNAIIPDYHIHGSQHTIAAIQKEFEKYMENVKVASIGQNVWQGFSKWLDQIGYQHQWSKIWCALYEKGLIDYVIYQGVKPTLETSSSLQQKRNDAR